MWRNVEDLKQLSAILINKLISTILSVGGFRTLIVLSNYKRVCLSLLDYDWLKRAHVQVAGAVALAPKRAKEKQRKVY